MDEQGNDPKLYSIHDKLIIADSELAALNAYLKSMREGDIFADGNTRIKYYKDVTISAQEMDDGSLRVVISGYPTKESFEKWDEYLKWAS